MSLDARASLAVTGIGGLGKTQLAIEYSYSCRDRYPNGIFWITAEADIASQIIGFSDTLLKMPIDAKEDVKINAFKTFLETEDLKLVVIDNIESDFDSSRFINPVHPHLHVLYTARGVVKHAKAFDIELLNPYQSQQLLISEAARSPTGTIDWEAINSICDLLNGLPLALELAGGYIRTTNINYIAYLKMLQHDSIGMLNNKDILSSYTEYNKDIKSAILISNSLVSNNAILESIADVLSISGARDVDLEYLLHMIGVGIFETVAAEIYLGDNLRIYHFDDESNKFTMHSLIREIQYQNFIESSRYLNIDVYASRAIDWFIRRVKDKDYRYAYHRDHDNLDALLGASEIFAPAIRARIIWLSSYTEYYRGRFNFAKEKLERAMKIYNDYSLNDEGFLAELFNDLAQNEVFDQRLTKEYESKALEIRERIYGIEHKDTIVSLVNLARTLASSSRDPYAKELMVKALTASEKIYTKNSRDYARVCMSASHVYSSLGDQEKSISYLKETESILDYLDMDLSNEMAQLLNLQGQVYFHKSEPKLAVDSLNKALHIVEGLYAENSPERALYYFNLGMTYLNANSLPMASVEFKKSHDIYTRLYDANHPMIADSVLLYLKTLYVSNGYKKEVVMPQIEGFSKIYTSNYISQKLREFKLAVLFRKKVSWHS